MKHCPNPDCPFLQQYKLIAEFRDEIETCPDCGTQLVAGEAPDIEAAPVAYEPLFTKTGDLDLVTLCLVDSEADAAFYKEKLEFQGIFVAIGRQSVTDEARTPPLAESPLFDVQVLRSDLMRATLFLDTLAPSDPDEDLDDEELDDEDLDDENLDDEELDDEDLAADAKGLKTDNDQDAEAAFATGSGSPTSPRTAIQVDEASAQPAGRMNQWLLVIVIAVVLILVALFLINRLAK